MEGLHAAVQVSVKSCAPETVDFFTGFELYILKTDPLIHLTNGAIL